MTILCYQLQSYQPALTSALSYYNSPFTLTARSTLRPNSVRNVSAVILRPDVLPTSAHLQVIRNLTQTCIVVAILNHFNHKQSVYWLEQGIHHCVVYPFRPDELRLNLVRLLGLQKQARPAPPLLKVAQQTREQLDNHLFIDHRSLLLVKDNLGVYLTGKEYRMLAMLYKRRNQLLSFQQIARLIDPADTAAPLSPNLISTYISQLRKKAHKIQANLRIKSVYGYGYYVEAAGRADFSAT